jgi:GNAT superfamily N-acetyltransferase
VKVVAWGAEHEAPFRALFVEAHVPCHCRYWHFVGTKNDWLARCATTPEDNLAEQLACARAGDLEARGLLALADDPAAAALGWMKLAPRAALPKLRALPAYRAALGGGDDDGVYSIACFLVHPRNRRTGVARALLDAAPAFVRAWGGRALEAYPRRVPEGAHTDLHDEEAWMGPESLFARAGFRLVAGEGAHPVLRYDL